MNLTATSRKLNRDVWLYSLPLILALVVRFWSLNSAPLSDAEATWALQALQVANGERFVLGANPVYVLLTGTLFRFFGAGDGLSRALPAFSGSLLVLAPFLLSRSSTLKFSRTAALVMACGLAVDPGLVVGSRLAGGPMLATSLSVLAIALWLSHHSCLAGISAGLALLSGPSIIPLAICLAITAGLVSYLFRQSHIANSTNVGEEDPQPISGSLQSNPKAGLSALGLTILLVGTLFLSYPRGLAAWAQQIPAYLAGWSRAGTDSPAVLQGLAAIVFYQPLALLLVLLSILRNLVKKTPGRLITLAFGIWIILYLLHFTLYPARQTIDLTGILIPLWGLAALEITYLWPERTIHPISYIQAAITLTLLSLLWFNLATMTRLAIDPSELFVRGAILLGILALVGLTATLVLLGWNWPVSRSGLFIGIGVALCLYTISVLWSAAYLRFNQPQELWFPAPGTGQARLMIKTLDDITEWQTSGYPQTLDLVVTVKSPSLRWELRNYQQAKYLSQPAANSQPAVVITPADQSLPGLASSYRGQDFVWAVLPGWQDIIPTAYVNWFTFRDAPLIQNKIILWVRSDLFKDAATENK